MNIVPIVDILQGRILINSEITIQGWIRTRRDSKIGISFLIVYDGSCFHSLQIVVNSTLINYQDDILHLTAGCSVIITGYVVPSIGYKQHIELHANKIKVLGWVDDPDTYPISAKKHTTEYLREVAHLRPRTNIIGAVTRIRHTLAQAIHRFMNKNGFFWITTPLITTSDAEGAGKMFHISTLDFKNIPQTPQGNIDFNKDFFGKETFLTVSGQLNGETYACALSKIYTFGPIFRAENSNTSHHLAEFWMVEPEVAFADLNTIISLAESMLKYVFKSLLNERIDDINFFVEKTNKTIINRLNEFIDNGFIQLEYTEAIKILQNNNNFEKKISWGEDLSTEHERYLSEKYINTLTLIKNHPKDIKAFYMRLNDDGKTVAAMDVLAPGTGEIIGGSQREERLNKLDQKLKKLKINKEYYWWYRDLRRYGTVPHSGFGLGFERLTAYVTGIQNIRDVIPFPRSLNNANF